ncbi:MAG: AAA family ATPase [Alphaproteobacteria bacterium]|nr:AAA family ATPase [Alphaproteobacteria bacterium]
MLCDKRFGTVEKNRKPLLLYGARQVGKTWLVRDFAKKNYRQCLELNFFTNEKLKQIFDTNISPDFLIMQLELLFNTKIETENTLLFLMKFKNLNEQ